jgi:putative transposase
MNANQALFSIAAMCRVFCVSQNGYYAWRKRGESKRALRDGKLLELIREEHAASDGTYGAPRIRNALANQGEHVACKRVARLMHADGLRGEAQPCFVVTTQRDERCRPAPDRVERNFVRSRPNELWLTDITYIPTCAGFLYLAVVLDAWSRRVVGWSMKTTMTEELVHAALAMALTRRARCAVLHSDQGSQYTASSFAALCKRCGIAQSMGSVGDAYDNAMCESFFATLKKERLHRRPLQTVEQTRCEVFQFIEGWYNTRRLHSALGYQSPADFERRRAA